MKSFKIFFLILLLGSYVNVNAQPVGVATVVLAGRKLDDIIKEFEESANRLVINGTTQGNLLISNSGNVLEVATRNLDYVISQQRKKLYDDLSPDIQNLFASLNQIITTANQAVDKIAKIEEVTNLDLVEFTNRLSKIVAAKKTDFYISSISGTSIAYQDNDFRINITGLGFGYPERDISYSSKLTINGQEIPVTYYDFTQKHQLIVTIPNDMIKKYFKDDAVVKVPITFQTTVSHNRALRGPRTTTYKVQPYLILLPIYPVEITLQQRTSSRVLDGIDKINSMHRFFPAHTCTTDRPCDYTDPWSCGINEQITSVAYDCKGPCGFAYALHAQFRPYNPDYSISDDKRSITVSRHYDCKDQAVDIYYYIHYQTFIDKYKDETPKKYKLKFNDKININLLPNNNDGNYIISGKLVTGQVINANSAGSVDPLLQVNSGRIGDNIVLTLSLKTQ